MSLPRIFLYALPLFLVATACAGNGDAGATDGAPSAAPAENAEPARMQVADGTSVPVIDIRNAQVIVDGVMGGGQPDEAQLRRAAEAGYRTIVNTRGSSEIGDFADEEELVRSLGMNYVFIPIGEGEPVTEAKARELADVLAGAEALPAMVHCRSGNRVGALFAAKAFVVDGVDAAAAMEFGTASGMRGVPAELEAMLAGAAGD